jgi:hypothetical protein
MVPPCSNLDPIAWDDGEEGGLECEEVDTFVDGDMGDVAKIDICHVRADGSDRIDGVGLHVDATREGGATKGRKDFGGGGRIGVRAVMIHEVVEGDGLLANLRRIAD